MTSSNEFCSETSVGNEPSWWAVDLGAIYEISNVVIFGRNDCCEERLSNFIIEIIRPCRDNNDWFEDSRIDICYHQQEPTKFLNASCHNKMIGKFVRIRLSNLNDRLALCEVEVHGIFIGFLKTATFPYACGFQGHSSEENDEILSSAIVHSDIQCTFICSYMKYCHVADFNKKTSTCILMKKKSGSTLVTNSDHNVFIVN
ncbi:Hypothetical predicted protein [Mytilus galloprovincialis]|uniref:F5/8 type C domain-containing protein n=1 Tax=Mytilus galloprovincialis TaxID=29158 RepID=A0A8B6E7F1_MYTGA|nr:Hypothetical predicted protein [Mytilus galloprovincialis]